MTTAETLRKALNRPATALELARCTHARVDDLYPVLVAMEARGEVRVTVDHGTHASRPVCRWELMDEVSA